MSTYKVKVKILVLRDDFGDLGPHTSPFRIDTLHRVAHDAGDGLGIKSEDIQCDETELIVCSVRQIRSQLPHDSVQILVYHPLQFLLVAIINHTDKPLHLRIDSLLLLSASCRLPIFHT